MARTPEPKTQAVRQLIDEYGPNLTWNQTKEDQASAKNLLNGLGFTETAASPAKRINENDFNVKKYLYLKQKGDTVVTERKGVGTKTTAELPKDLTVVLATVNRHGGLTDYRAAIAKKQDEVERLRERLAEAEAKVAEMEENVSVYETLKKAVA